MPVFVAGVANLASEENAESAENSSFRAGSTYTGSATRLFLYEYGSL